MLLVLSISVVAQKKELKAAEKTFKKKEYAATLKQLEVVAPLLEGAAEKYQLQYLHLKAASIFGNGKKSENDVAAAAAFNELIAFEEKNRSNKYSKEAKSAINTIVQRTASTGSEMFNEKDYKGAGEKFQMVYDLSPTDTLFLDNAALAAFYDTDYDKAIELYRTLLEIGYTGIKTQYKAESKINGEAVYFNSKKDMDKQVMMKVVIHPEVVTTESRTAGIAKNIALSYIAKGDEQGALKAIEDAKKLYPNDYTLIISEANIYYKLGDNEKFLAGLKKAIELRPDDPQLYYNIGVLTLEQGYVEEAVASFNKAIELKPDFADAYNNIGVAILDETKPIVDEMNKNLSNFKKYDELMLKQKAVYKKALPYFEKTIEYSPENESVMRTLIGLYELLEMYDKQKATQAKLDAL